MKKVAPPRRPSKAPAPATKQTIATEPAAASETQPAAAPVVEVTTPTASPANKAPAKATPAKAATPAKTTAAAGKPSAAVKKTTTRAPSAPSKATASAATTPAPPAPAVESSSPVSAEVSKKKKKSKVVRDSFTMPESDYAKIAELKKRGVEAGINIKKSELLRAGLLALEALSPAKFKVLLAGLENIKTGRPAAES